MIEPYRSPLPRDGASLRAGLAAEELGQALNHANLWLSLLLTYKYRDLAAEILNDSILM